jgi:hypothetical protein
MTDQPKKNNTPLVIAAVGIACVLMWQTYTENSARECNGFIGQRNVYDTVIAAQWTFTKGCELTTTRNLRSIGEDPYKTEVTTSESFKWFRDRHLAADAM